MFKVIFQNAQGCQSCIIWILDMDMSMNNKTQKNFVYTPTQHSATWQPDYWENVELYELCSVLVL